MLQSMQSGAPRGGDWGKRGKAGGVQSRSD